MLDQGDGRGWHTNAGYVLLLAGFARLAAEDVAPGVLAPGPQPAG